jgi:hypothetical protein
MKHLLNNLSEEEKNSIRGQHTGGMLVNNSRFNSLLENKLGNSKPLVEQFDDEDDSRIKNKLKHPGSEIMMVGHDYTLIKVEGTGEEQRKAVEWFGGYYKWTEGESHWEESIPNEKFGLRLLVNGPIFFIFPNDDNGDVGLVTGLPSERYLIQFEHRRFVDRLDKKFDVVRRFNGDFAEFKDILKEYLYPSEPTLDNELNDEELDEDTSWMNDLEEGKNSIRGQHTGGMQVNNSRFNTLLENKLGNSKPLVEQLDDEDDYELEDENEPYIDLTDDEDDDIHQIHRKMSSDDEELYRGAPERLVKHMDSGKISGTHKHGVGYTPNEFGKSLGHSSHPTSIPNYTKMEDLDDINGMLRMSNPNKGRRYRDLEEDTSWMNDLEEGNDW